MAGFWGKRKRDDAELGGYESDVAKGAGMAVVWAYVGFGFSTDDLFF